MNTGRASTGTSAATRLDYCIHNLNNLSGLDEFLLRSSLEKAKKESRLSNCRYDTFPGVGRNLRVDDIGKKVFRVAPFKTKNKEYNFSYGFNSYQESQQLLTSISKVGELVGEIVLNGDKLISSFQCSKEWNDGNWITEDEFIQYRTANPGAKPTIVNGYNIPQRDIEEEAKEDVSDLEKLTARAEQTAK